PVALNGSGVVQSNPTATLTVSGSPHTVTANYLGSPNFGSSTGTLAGGQIVNKANSVTAITSTQNPTVFGQSTTFTATVRAVSPGAGVPAGTVQFLDGGNAITGCTAQTTAAGVAACTTNALTGGNHTITAQYSGDTNFNTSSGNLNTNPQVVNKAA